MSVYEMPVAFKFTVRFARDSDVVFSCQEVTGLEAEIAVEMLAEGGENRFSHRLPKAVQRSNLVLKRGLTTDNSLLFKWFKATLEGDLSARIETHDLVVTLVDADDKPVSSWQLSDAFPVKWEASGFDALRNEIAVETMELAYGTLTRSV